MRATMLERFLDAPLKYLELRAGVSAYVDEKLAGHEMNNESRSTDIGQLVGDRVKHSRAKEELNAHNSLKWWHES